MLDKKEVSKLKKAAKNVKTENDTFYIKGEKFMCRWNGHNFTWTVNGSIYENISAKEVVEWIADGKYIDDYCYDYNNY